MPEPRFATVTMHPAIDRIVEVWKLRSGALLDARLRMEVPAGKGVNTARSLACLGAHSPRSVVWLGENEKKSWAKELKAQGIALAVCARPVPTRVCLTIIERSTCKETHLKDRMASPSRGEESAFCGFMAGLSLRNSHIAFCGSAPEGTGRKTLRAVFEAIRAQGASVIADTSGVALEVAGTFDLDGLKANDHEMGAWLGLNSVFKVENPRHRRLLMARLAPAASEGGGSKSRKMPRTILITLGAAGAILTNGRDFLQARPPRSISGFSTTGCGDAATAGWIWALGKGLGLEDQARWAVACGTAKLLNEDPGCLKNKDVRRILERVKVTRAT